MEYACKYSKVYLNTKSVLQYYAMNLQSNAHFETLGPVSSKCRPLRNPKLILICRTRGKEPQR